MHSFCVALCEATSPISLFGEGEGEGFLGSKWLVVALLRTSCFFSHHRHCGCGHVLPYLFVLGDLILPHCGAGSVGVFFAGILRATGT